MRENKPYWKHILELWDTKEWISNEDFRIKTKGSPKFTSRISDMRKKGVEIVSRRVDNIITGEHNEYKLITDKSVAEELMRNRKRKVA